MSPSLLPAGDLAEARKIFNDRRSRVEELFDSRTFLMLGYVNRTSTLAEEPVPVVINGVSQEYSLPDSRHRESHSSSCKARLLQFAGLSGSLSVGFSGSIFGQKHNTNWTAQASELLKNKAFRKFIDTHGGFWCDVVLDDDSDIESRPEELLLVPGEAEVPGGTPADYMSKFLKLPGVKELSGDHPKDADEARIFFETVLKLMDPCCHLAKRACLMCGLDFLPTGWTALELRVGYNICPMCCHVATDWRQARVWLKSDKLERLNEIQVGLRIGKQVSHLLPKASDAPQWDSLDAMKAAKLDKLSPELAADLFLCVALRPKLSQIRKDYESWDAWVHQLGGNFEATYSVRQRIIEASDGHICFSKGEAQICEYLTSREIAHSKEPMYADLAGRDEALVRHFVGDFRVNDVIIEYAGLSGAKEYDERLATKVSWASQLGIKVIVVSPDKLHDLENVLSSITKEA
jgi:hypothetical protein